MAHLGEEELVLSREQAFPFFLAGGLDLTGAALVARGERGEGLDRMREGARAYRAAGVRIGLVHLAHLAEVLLDTGHVDEALAVAEDALAEPTEERVYWAELQRIKGGALLKQHARSAAEACFREAVDIARAQGAKVFELRALTDLMNLDRESPDGSVRAQLGACRAWFSEGLDLADLRQAGALLSATPAPPKPPP
jgi:tetratricopeptide (TPR) repeat protein